MDAKIFEGTDATSLARSQKWTLFSPFLLQHGRSSLAYATLQDGMEYFLHGQGYIAYTRVRHPVFAPGGRRIVLSDPVCADSDLASVLGDFLKFSPKTAFAVISERCAEVLRGLGFKVNCIGVEPSLPVQTYNTKGNWNELDLIKRARNEIKREGISIRETPVDQLDAARLSDVSARWISSKKVNDREIWI